MPKITVAHRYDKDTRETAGLVLLARSLTAITAVDGPVPSPVGEAALRVLVRVVHERGLPLKAPARAHLIALVLALQAEIRESRQHHKETYRAEVTREVGET